MKIHPDDILFFQEVSHAMRRVAREYELPLRSIEHLPDNYIHFETDRLGDCNGTGDIRLLLRAKINGVWTSEPMSPEEVWKTAAHELAHLRHMNHGLAFQAFEDELLESMRNQTETHREKIIRKIVKLQAQRDGEAQLGNSAAAEAFAAAINRMLIEYELNPSDIDFARGANDDPVVELRVDLARYRIRSKESRIAWQESLARVVAQGNLCTFLVCPGSNAIVFVGTKAHATVAEYTYGVLVPLADKMSKQEEIKYWRETGGGRGHMNQAKGFRAAWLRGFVNRLSERFEEIRREAVRDFEARVARTPGFVPAPGVRSVALVRLDGALQKVQRYIDDRFKGKSKASCLSGQWSNNREGSRRGREAADQMPLGRRALTGGHTRGQLK